MSREREDHLLQPSAQVNEAFVRLLGGAPVEWDSRASGGSFLGRPAIEDAARLVRAEEVQSDRAKARGH